MTERESQRVIRTHQEAAPVSVHTIARELGIRVYLVRKWPKVISGQILQDRQRGGSSGYAIFTNANHPRTRRRFTIAHEIAHFVLHRFLIGDGIQHDALYRSGLSDQIEREANRMAADILMPWRLVDEVIDGLDTVDELANVFEVSRSAMSIRLEVPFETRKERDMGNALDRIHR